MWRDGLVEEVRGLEQAGLREGRTASQALGYAQVLRFLAGEWGEDEAREQTVKATRRFARRQESWFRRDPRVIWLDAGPGADLPAQAVATIGRWVEFARGQFAKGHGTENDFVILPDPGGAVGPHPGAHRAALRPAGRDRGGRGAARGPHRLPARR